MYLKFMFDFLERRNVCIQVMKKVYEVGLYGNDKQVFQNIWCELFLKGCDVEIQGEYESDDGEYVDDYVGDVEDNDV